MKITLTKITTKQAEGKNGPYTRMGIQCKEYGQKWLSGFLNKSNERWQEGMTVEVDVEPKFVNGKEYLNFRAVGKLEMLERRVYELEKEVRTLKANGNNGASTKDNGQSQPTNEPDWDDLNAELAGQQN